MESPDPIAEDTAVSYLVDPLDRVAGVNKAWTDFAIMNGAFSVLPNGVIGSNLWSHISSETVREVYRLILRRVRGGRRVTFSYRCDSPARRRKFEMTVALAEGGNVRFTSKLLSEEEREPVRLLEPGQPRNDRMMVVCSWCQRVSEPGGTWLPVEDAVVRDSLMEAATFPRITHGMCDDCLNRYVSELG
jgi:hypothetical protein